MKTSNNAIELIKQFEGCRLKAYQCPARIWTIGFGNTFYLNGNPVKQGDVITQEQADELLIQLLPKYERTINTLVKRQLTQNQYDALVSFVWNNGAGNFQGSGLLKRINKDPKDLLIEGEFNKWVKARINGELTTLKGLISRRNKEWLLYNSK